MPGELFPSLSASISVVLLRQVPFFFVFLLAPETFLAAQFYTMHTDNSFIAEAKAKLRKTLRHKRRALSQEICRTLSERITKRLVATDAWQRAKSVALYIPKRNAEREVETQRLLEQAFAQHKRILLPRIEAQNTLNFLPWTPGDPLQQNTFGILEPYPAKEQKQAIDLFVLPGLAFDRQGTRLGFGGGYYDRTLARESQACFAGICYSFQLLPLLPKAAWDQNVDLICTEDEVLCL